MGETRTGRERRAEREKLYGSKNVNGGDGMTGTPKGRFIDDDEDEEALRDIEAEKERSKKAAKGPVADPASYVTSRSNGGATNGTNHADSDADEEIEDAGKSIYCTECRNVT